MPSAARVLRLSTAVMVIGLCCVAAFRGWQVVRFAYARAEVAAGADAADALRPWSEVPGVAGAALEAVLRDSPQALDSAAAARRADTLAALLRHRPLSSQGWLSLAAARLVAGSPYQDVLQAVALSRLTGPNEGRLLLQRGIFGLLLWQSLPPQDRDAALHDMARAMGGMPVGDAAIAPARTVLDAMTADDRRDIADRLRTGGLAAAELRRLGL